MSDEVTSSAPEADFRTSRWGDLLRVAADTTNVSEEEQTHDLTLHREIEELHKEQKKLKKEMGRQMNQLRVACRTRITRLRAKHHRDIRALNNKIEKLLGHKGNGKRMSNRSLRESSNPQKRASDNATMSNNTDTNTAVISNDDDSTDTNNIGTIVSRAEGNAIDAISVSTTITSTEGDAVNATAGVQDDQNTTESATAEIENDKSMPDSTSAAMEEDHTMAEPAPAEAGTVQSVAESFSERYPWRGFWEWDCNDAAERADERDREWLATFKRR